MALARREPRPTFIERMRTHTMKTETKPRRVRWWMPAVILALAAASLIYLQFSTDLESNFKSMQRFMTLALATLLLLLWLLFFSRLRWRTRFIGLGLFALMVAAFTQLARFDGTVDGSGAFRVVWKWRPKRDGNVGELKANPPTTNQLALAASADYPAFLGRDRRGVLENISLEHDWATHPPQEIWRQPIGLSWSAFAVAGARAVTQEQRGEKELVVCYETAAGRCLWAHTNYVRFSEFMGGDGPRATPTLENGRVLALGATGILDCLDAATGRLIWSRDTLKENGLPNLMWAKSSSPLVFEKLVVVTGGFTNGPALLAYHLHDGSPAWRVGTDKASYSSPMLGTIGGKPQIVCVNAGTVTGHEPSDGRILWEYTWATDKWAKCAQPVLLEGDRVFLSAGYGIGCVLLQVKGGADGKVSLTEVWKNRNMKSQFSNLVVRDGFLYGLDDGILVCLDLATGERKWKDGRYGHGQVLRVADLLLVQTEPGPIVLVEANPSHYREIARLDALKAKTWNAPALAGEFLLTRNDQEAVCYRLPLRSSHAKVALQSHR